MSECVRGGGWQVGGQEGVWWAGGRECAMVGGRGGRSGVAAPLVTSSISVMTSPSSSITLPLPLSSSLPLAAISSLAREGPKLLPRLLKSYCRRRHPINDSGIPHAPEVDEGEIGGKNTWGPLLRLLRESSLYHPGLTATHPKLIPHWNASMSYNAVLPLSFGAAVNPGEAVCRISEGR